AGLREPAGVGGAVRGDPRNLARAPRTVLRTARTREPTRVGRITRLRQRELPGTRTTLRRGRLRELAGTALADLRELPRAARTRLGAAGLREPAGVGGAVR
ncbi:hypothetical protein AN220_28405, partial [Streptomyces nanshensis]